MEDTVLIVNELSKYDIPMDVQLFLYKKKKFTIKNKYIKLLNQQIDFEEYLEKVKDAKIL